MKQFLTVAAVLAVLGFGGRHFYANWSRGNTVHEAETRVSGVLHDLDRKDHQTALCLWAKGDLMMTSDEMSYHTDAFDDFVRETGFTSPASWEVTGAELQEDGHAVLVTVTGPRGALYLWVVDGDPIEVAR